MKLGVITRILKEDLQRFGDIPAWIDSLISPLNQFMTQIAQALQNNLSFADNFSCKQTTITLTSGVETSVNVGGKRVVGMLPLIVKDQTIDRWGLKLKQDGTIGVTVYFGGSAVDGTTKAECTFVILY